MVVDIKETIHLTDLLFIDVCNKKYGINRGVYNTIDAWFYKQGMTNILDRRHAILSFLEFIKRKAKFKSDRCKFGHGGLTIRLEEYYFQSIETKSASNL